MQCVCSRVEVLHAVWMCSVGVTKCDVEMVGWRYLMLCGCCRLEVIDAVWM